MEPDDKPWTVSFVDFKKVERALSKLSPDQLRLALEALFADFKTHGLTLFRTSCAKWLGKGLAEYRYREDPDVLVRFFFYLDQGRCVVVLSAYDKGRAPSQKRQNMEIARARKIMEIFSIK